MPFPPYTQVGYKCIHSVPCMPGWQTVRPEQTEFDRSSEWNRQIVAQLNLMALRNPGRLGSLWGDRSWRLLARYYASTCVISVQHGQVRFESGKLSRVKGLRKICWSPYRELNRPGNCGGTCRIRPRSRNYLLGHELHQILSKAVRSYQ